MFKLLSPDQTGVTFANTVTTERLAERSDRRLRLQRRRRRRRRHRQRRAAGHVLFRQHGLESPVPEQGTHAVRRHHRARRRQRPSGGPPAPRWWTSTTTGIWTSTSPFRGPNGAPRSSGRICCSSTTGTGPSRKPRRNTASPTPASRTHAAFLDYNGDGCLDLFLLNNSPHDFSRGDVRRARPAGIAGETPDSYNQLYRNSCNGTFTNASREAGILRDAGYGLGVAVADLNGDGWPDIYVSNDVVPNDVLYVNNGDGTFTNKRAAVAQACELRRHGRRHRRFQQRRLARHPSGGHDAARVEPPQTHERVHDVQQPARVAQPRISRRLLRQHAATEQRTSRRTATSCSARPA